MNDDLTLARQVNCLHSAGLVARWFQVELV